MNKKLMVMLMSVILIIMILIVTLLMQLNDINEGIEVTDEIKENHEEFSELHRVEEINQFFTVKSIINKYYTNINYFNASLVELDIVDEINEQEIKQEYTLSAINALKQMLDSKSIEYLSLNDSNIPTIFEKYKNKTYRVDDIYYKQETVNSILYYASITLDHKQNVGLVIKTDLYNNTFSIYPEEYIKSKNITKDTFEKDFKIDSIEYIKANELNTYTNQTITSKALAQYYLYDFGDFIVNNKQIAYDMLDNNYKLAKFPTFESFEKYLQNSPINFGYLRLDGLKVSQGEESTIYTCQDQYGNIYVINESSLMNYTVQLDNYTLENKEFETTYKEASLRDRGILNIDKFFKMINMQDYSKAYELLDNSFKQNYFMTESLFENYMKNLTFRYNKVEYKEYSNQISSIHMYKIVLTDATQESLNEVPLNIMVKLGTDYNFTISFEVN